MPSSAPLLRSFFEGADSNRAARNSASAAAPADEAPKSTVTIVDGRLVVKSSSGTVLVRGEPSKVAKKPAPAAKKPAPAAPFAISSLPQDVHERIAGMLFKEFSDSLSEALGQARHSREELENAAATADSAAGGSNEVDMSGVFSAIKSLSRWVSISSMYRATFRRFYVSAVFRAIVHEATADTDADGVLMGVMFSGRSYSVERCSAEISHLSKIVSVGLKKRFTGGMQKLLVSAVAQSLAQTTSHRCNIDSSAQ
jgi:hypothetical protein